MSGGIWTSQNKVLPGVYINVKSQPAVNAAVGTRGTVAIAKALSWGKTGEILEITPGEDTTPIIGYDLASDQARFLREMMRGTDISSGPTKILLYRAAGTGGAAASASIGDLTVTAAYKGVRGNDISVSVSADPDETGTFVVAVFVDGVQVDAQVVSAIADLTADGWVTFAGEGSLTASAGVNLEGGADPTASAADDAAFLTAVEPYDFDIIAYDGGVSTVADIYVAFAKRMNEQIGKKCQAVVSGVQANSKYVISVHNGVKLSDGTALTAAQAVWWVAGAEAGATYYQSLTYAQYPGAASASPKLTDAQVEAAIAAGQLCFIDTFGTVKICTDIDTKTTITPTEGAEFKKNRVMRVINQLCNDIYRYFSENFIGKVDNNESGRNLLRAWIVGYLNEMQGNNGIQNFVADDVTVEPGGSIDAVLITIAIQPVDAIEKIYISVTVDANLTVTVTA